ncbi:hypothetical protein [Pelagibius sp. Alg239-R121]|uniref:hypothetical protein n=1 Tax=Pelagibius sp. Alg239-R121 TaxID=2993448 RepID=UPI0024A75072|nr:hypothetical protein [Pelagibius sp. Alg239-R121]
MKLARSIFGGLAVLSAFAVSVPASAQDATPSHVYQVVDNINAELSLLLEADDSVALVDKSAPALTPRKPRHVIQKAREVFLKVQLLRRINGLPVTELQPFPVRAIKPADVKGMVEVVLTDLRGLREPFAVSADAEPAALPEGKTPTDVYGNLTKTSAWIDGLGMPKTVPNDVYRVALTIVSDLQKVRIARGMTDDIAVESVSSGKKPNQVYKLGVQLLERIGELAKNERFAISGGVVMPNLREGKITPAHVIDILNNVQAEVVAMKLAVGASDPSDIIAAPAGKTPSDVYDALETALQMVETLQVNS